MAVDGGAHAVIAVPIDWSAEGPDAARAPFLNRRGISNARPTQSARGLSRLKPVPDESGLEKWAKQRGAALDFVPQYGNRQSPRPTQRERGLASQHPLKRIRKKVTRFEFEEGDTVLGDVPRRQSPAPGTPPPLPLGSPALFRVVGVPPATKPNPKSAWPGNYPSFELQGPDPKTSSPEAAVKYWLQLHAAEIAASEKQWNVDRRAIAGAIAWEALQNPHSVSWRASGPGKPHAFGWSGPPQWTEVVEILHPERFQRFTDSYRLERLKNPAVAIDYIGAIMDTIAQMAEHYRWQIRNNPALLTYAYQARNVRSWQYTLLTKATSDIFVLPRGGESRMGAWVDQNLLYLEGAVGAPTVR